MPEHNNIIRVSEIFTSIQGEGRNAGLPMRFVRLHGCNLKCIYCDTGYSSNKHHASKIDKPIEYALEQLLDILKENSHLPVYITGGEPLIQSLTPKLADSLIETGRIVFIDTNGTLDLSAINPHVKKIIDIKTPGSMSGGEFLESNIACVNPDDEIKFVVTSHDDFTWGIEKTKSLRLLDKTSYVLFQPAWDMVSPKDLAEWIISSNLQVRLSLQLHKYIWGPDTKGV